MSITLNNKNFIGYIIILVIYIYISKIGNINTFNILNNKITSFCYYSYLINKF